MALWYEEKIKACSCSDSKRWWLRKITSEFLGTFVFVFISCCSVASVNSYSNSVPEDETVDDTNTTIFYDTASILYINFGIAFGYAIGLYISIENDGYLNMALTIIFRFMGKLDNFDTFCLLVGQLLGAFSAALLTWGVYYDQLNDFEDIMSNVIFCSVVNGSNHGIAAFDELLKSSLFTIGVLAILDGRKNENEDQPVKTVKPPKSFEPFMIALVLFIVGVAFSFRTPFYFNPLQDFGGRLAAVAAGCENMCTNKNPIWWPIIPICVPVLGACCAAFIYIFFIENNHILSSSTRREGDEEMLNMNRPNYGSTDSEYYD